MNEADISKVSPIEIYKKVGEEIVRRNKEELEDMRKNPKKYIARHTGGVTGYYHQMGMIEQI